MNANTRNAHAIATCLLMLLAPPAAAQRDTIIESPTRSRADSIYPQLTLREVISRALTVNPTVALGVGGLKDARAAQRAARGTYLPTLSVSATANVTESQSGGGGGGGNTAGGGANRPDTTRAGGTGGKTITHYATIGVGAAYDVYTGGRRRALNEAARAAVRGAVATLDSSRFAARFAAESTFYEVVRAGDLIEVAEAGLAEARVLVRFTRDMLRAGTVMKSDLLRAELQVVTMQTQAARRQRHAACRRVPARPADRAKRRRGCDVRQRVRGNSAARARRQCGRSIRGEVIAAGHGRDGVADGQ